MSESSNEAHVPEPAWRRVLKPLHIPYAPRTKLQGDDAALFAKCVTASYGNDGSIRDISGHTNRSYATVRRTLLDAGVKLRERGGRRRTVGPTVT